ncbi:MAG: hypothetical protein FWE95_00240 [Planctomycetaceae bacterium]|nr:hypothetical protein [Planctomycetaceae bacterium]
MNDTNDSSSVPSTQEPIRPFWRSWVIVILLLGIHAILLGYSAAKFAPTALEGPLLAAGVSHWELGRYELYRVNPPLVRMVAATPVVLVGCETDWSRFVDGPRTRPEYSIGSQFIEINGERSLWLMTLARWACIPFSLIGGLYCFFWARELWRRDLAGLIALTLWCFCPLMLGNGALITNDTAATSLGIVAGYYFWHWLQSPTWTRCLIVALTLALAILAKTTWLILFGLLPIMAALWFGIMYWKREKIGTKLSVIGLQIATIFLLTIWFINIFYGFDGSFENYGNYSFVSDKLSVIDNQNPFLASLPVPLPKQFVLGIDTQARDFEQYGQKSYLAGRWQDRGWYHYYVYGLLVKWPHGTQALFLLAVLMLVFWKKTKLSKDELMMILPGLAVLLAVSSQLEFNMHFRYVLPFVGFAFIFIGKVALLAESKVFWRVVVSVCIALSTASSLLNYPHSLAYFNELSGGTKNGHRHMLHSAIDWGQDLTYLKKWLEMHPEIELDGLAYHGGFDPSAIGINAPRPPVGQNATHFVQMDSSKMGPQPGWYALSTNALWGPSGEYDYFRHFTPVATAGRTIHIYHLTQEDVEWYNDRHE